MIKKAAQVGITNLCGHLRHNTKQALMIYPSLVTGCWLQVTGYIWTIQWLDSCIHVCMHIHLHPAEAESICHCAWILRQHLTIPHSTGIVFCPTLLLSHLSPPVCLSLAHWSPDSRPMYFPKSKDKTHNDHYLKVPQDVSISPLLPTCEAFFRSWLLVHDWNGMKRTLSIPKMEFVSILIKHKSSQIRLASIHFMIGWRALMINSIGYVLWMPWVMNCSQQEMKKFVGSECTIQNPLSLKYIWDAISFQEIVLNSFICIALVWPGIHSCKLANYHATHKVEWYIRMIGISFFHLATFYASIP